MLLYYADQAEGFTPAKLTIHNATGIPETRIKNVRNNLQDMSLIEYVFNERYQYIFVNWTVIIGYYYLKEPLQVGGRARRNFVQQSMSGYINNPQAHKDMNADHFISKLYAEDCIKWLASLTDQEYRYTRKIINRLNKESRKDTNNDQD